MQLFQQLVKQYGPGLHAVLFVCDIKFRAVPSEERGVGGGAVAPLIFFHLQDLIGIVFYSIYFVCHTLR